MLSKITAVSFPTTLQTFVSIVLGLCLEGYPEGLRLLLSLSLPLAWFGVILRSTYNGATISTMFLHILHKRFLGGVLLALALAATFGTGFLVLAWEEGRDHFLDFRQGAVAFFRLPLEIFMR